MRPQGRQSTGFNSHEESPLTPSPVTGADRSGTSIVDATNVGFRNIGEYLRDGPKLIAEQKRADQAMELFYKKIARLDAEYAQMQRAFREEAAALKNTLKNLASVPGDENRPPAASRNPAREPGPGAAVAETQKPFSPIPNMSGLFGPFGQGSDQAEALPAAAVPPVAKASSPIPESMAALEGGLESSRKDSAEPPVQSTIAVLKKGEEADGKGAKNGLVLGKNGKGILKSGGSSLRDSLRAALARKPASGGTAGKGADASEESGSQQATRSALDEMRALAEGGNSSGSAGGGKFDSPLAGYNSGGLGGEGFKLAGSETEAEVARLKSEVSEKQAAPEVLGKESADLFDRVRVAHVRSLKNGRVSLLQKN